MLKRYRTTHKTETPNHIPRGYLEGVCYGYHNVVTCPYKNRYDCPAECNLKEVKVKPSRLERWLMKWRKN